MAGVLIYGAYGYTGTLIAERAVEAGLRPTLAGRDAGRLQTIAARLGLEARAFSLSDVAEVVRNINGMAAVLHVAGPFSQTARPMALACLQARAHYVDVTGEIDVFEALADLDAAARAAGVALLPGAGYDVVPSDCLAAHVVGRLPGATRLRLSMGGFSGFSRGTARTMVEAAGRGQRVRRGGALVELDKARTALADFGAGPRRTVGVSWGDVATAWRSTGAPDIEVFFEASPLVRFGAAAPTFVRRILARPSVQAALKRRIDRHLPPGPTAEARDRGRSLFLGEAWNAAGDRVASRLETPDAYALTARTAVEIARRAAAGDIPAGFQTSSKAFGADFILGFEGVRRVDL